MRADQTVPFLVMQNLKDLDGRRMDGAMRSEIARRISELMPALALGHLAAEHQELRSIGAIVEAGAERRLAEPSRPAPTLPIDPLSWVPVGAIPDKSVILNAMRWAADLADADVPRRPEILKQRLKDGTWSFTYTWPHDRRGAWRSAVDRLGEQEVEERMRFQMERMGYKVFVSVGGYRATPWGLSVKVRPARSNVDAHEAV
jgi:hypothetical protein